MKFFRVVVFTVAVIQLQRVNRIMYLVARDISQKKPKKNVTIGDLINYS